MPFKKAKPTDKPLTKAKIIEAIANETELPKKEVQAVMDAQQELAYAQAPVGFSSARRARAATRPPAKRSRFRRRRC